MLLERARENCGARYPHLTRYQFEGRERISGTDPEPATFAVRQELSCLVEPPPAEVGAVVPSDWQQTPEDERLITTLAQRYFDLFDAQDVTGLRQLLDAEMLTYQSEAEMAAELSEFHRNAGTPGRHQVKAVTWYVNPATAPRPGVYVAVDFERNYSGLLLNCGYLIWYREADGRYVLTRTESNTVSRPAAGVDPPDLNQFRAMWNCR
jgi:hypothetical protein